MRTMVLLAVLGVCSLLTLLAIGARRTHARGGGRRSEGDAFLLASHDGADAPDAGDCGDGGSDGSDGGCDGGGSD